MAASISSMKYCSNCGSAYSVYTNTNLPLQSNASFVCSKCGHLVSLSDAFNNLQNPNTQLLPKPPQTQHAINIPTDTSPASTSDPAKHLKLTLKSRDCGCVRSPLAKRSKCYYFPVNLWIAAHLWCIFFMIEFECIAGYLIYLCSDCYILYLSLIIFGIIPCILQIYAVRHCNSCLMYIIRIIVWIELISCVVSFISLAVAMALSELDNIKYLLLAYGLIIIQYILLIWMENVFFTVHTLAKYFNDNGIYPVTRDIRDFDPKYFVCFVDPCGCCCLSFGFLCVFCCLPKLGQGGYDEGRALGHYTQAVVVKCC